MNSESDQASSFPPWLQSAGKETPVQPQEEAQPVADWRKEGAVRTGPEAQSVNWTDSTPTGSWPASDSESQATKQAQRKPHSDEKQQQVQSSGDDTAQAATSTSQFVRVPVKSSVLREGFQPAATQQPGEQAAQPAPEKRHVPDPQEAGRRSKAEQNQPTGPYREANNKRYQVFKPVVEENSHAAVVSSTPPPTEPFPQAAPMQPQSPGQAAPLETQAAPPTQNPPAERPPAQTPAEAPAPTQVPVAQAPQSPSAQLPPQAEPPAVNQTPPAGQLPQAESQFVAEPAPVASTQPPPPAAPPAAESTPAPTPPAESAPAPTPPPPPQAAQAQPQPQIAQTAPSPAPEPPVTQAEFPVAQAAPRPQPAPEPEPSVENNAGLTAMGPQPYPEADTGQLQPASSATAPWPDSHDGASLQGNPFDPSDDPNQYLAPPAGLDQSILIDPVKRAPKSGWRKIIHAITAGYINLGDSEKVDRHQKLIDQARAQLRGDYKVAVLSLKGGVGKTTTSVMLGGIFASLRGDRVIAIDANPDFGNLAQRAAVPRTPTIRDLLNATDIEKYSDVRTYTTQAESNLEVIGSDRDPEISEAFSEDDYRQAIDVLQHYYNIILTDCGTGLMHSAMKGVLDLANTLILVTSPALDGAQSASATLDWLSHQGYGQFVANAIVVVSSLPSGSPSVDVKQLVEHFQSRTRAVQVIPYDKHLSEGAVIDLERLDRKTYMAYLELAALVAQDFASWHRHAR